MSNIAITPSPIPGHLVVTDASGKSTSFAPSLISTIEQLGTDSTILTFAGHAVTILLDFETVINAIADFVGKVTNISQAPAAPEPPAPASAG